MLSRYGAPVGTRPTGPRSLVVSLAAIGLCLPLPAVGAIGGPDTYGYTWVDSDDGGPSYDYEFGPSSGQLFLADDGSQTVSLPFVFPFQDQEWTTIRVHANGGVTFGSTADLAASHGCPVAATDAPGIYPMWMDLDPSTGGEIYAGVVGTAGTRRFIIEWYQVPPYSNVGLAGDLTFEIKLFEEDGHIEFHYDDVDAAGSSWDNAADAYVGLGAPDDALPYSCDQGLVGGDSALSFLPPPCNDGDGDGVCEREDCDNGNADVYPGAPEICDGLDSDCSGAPGADEVDEDVDGYLLCENDCDDTDPDLYPGDKDGDGWSPCLGDCDDTDALVNQVDNDGDGLSGCDGDCNDANANLSLADVDGDGHTSCEDDCDDDDPTVYEGAAEQCDGRDNDCDGTIDENPNCAGDDDDSAEVDPVAWGCFVRCDASGDAGTTGWAWAALLLLGLRRRRERR